MIHCSQFLLKTPYTLYPQHNLAEYLYVNHLKARVLLQPCTRIKSVHRSICSCSTKLVYSRTNKTHLSEITLLSAYELRINIATNPAHTLHQASLAKMRIQTPSSLIKTADHHTPRVTQNRDETRGYRHKTQTADLDTLTLRCCLSITTPRSRTARTNRHPSPIKLIESPKR